jgi:hypothetical protein
MQGFSNAKLIVAKQSCITRRIHEGERVKHFPVPNRGGNICLCPTDDALTPFDGLVLWAAFREQSGPPLQPPDPAIDWAEPFAAAQRFSHTMRMLMSAGDTPDMRDACPIVAGRILLSFWRASSLKLGTDE